MIDLLKELKGLMREKEISAETCALFLDVSGQEIRRWLAGKFTPNLSSRKKIRSGLRRMRKNL